LLVGLVASVVTLGVLALVGIALFSYYAGELPATPDKVFPHFITHQLPRGLAGLVVAALFAAAMSSLDSGMNSLSTVVTVDFYRRLRKSPTPPDEWEALPSGTEPSPAASAADDDHRPAQALPPEGSPPPPTDIGSGDAAAIVDDSTAHDTDRRELALARLVTCLTGCVAVFIAILLSCVPEGKRGNILDATNQINSFIIGPLGGLFLIAMFQRRCKGSTAIFSAVVGMGIGFVMALGHMFTAFGVDDNGDPRRWTWMWVMPVTTTLTFLIAVVVTWLRGLFPPATPSPQEAAPNGSESE
jgi:Na+/proline symporter